MSTSVLVVRRSCFHEGTSRRVHTTAAAITIPTHLFQQKLERQLCFVRSRRCQVIKSRVCEFLQQGSRFLLRAQTEVAEKAEQTIQCLRAGARKYVASQIE